MTYIQPFFALLVFIALGASLFSWTELRKSSAKLLMMATLGLFLFSWPPLAWVLVRTLEARYPPGEISPAGAQAIVVLSSAVYPPTPAIPTPRLGNDTYERCLYSAGLFKKMGHYPDTGKRWNYRRREDVLFDGNAGSPRNRRSP